MSGEAVFPRRAGTRFSGVVVDEDIRYDWVTGRVRGKHSSTRGV